MARMKCLGCGKRIVSGEPVCPHCGTPVGWNAAPLPKLLDMPSQPRQAQAGGSQSVERKQTATQSQQIRQNDKTGGKRSQKSESMLNQLARLLGWHVMVPLLLIAGITVLGVVMQLVTLIVQLVREALRYFGG